MEDLILAESWSESEAESQLASFHSRGYIARLVIDWGKWYIVGSLP